MLETAFSTRKTCYITRPVWLLENRDWLQELDQIERQIDERIAGAITRVGEARARQLLGRLKFITDLERIGDLVMGAAHRLHGRRERLARADADQLIEMSVILCAMLEQIHRGFTSRDIECAREVLRVDSQVDRICHSLFQRHLADKDPDPQIFEVLLIAQAFERVGDHAKNLAETSKPERGRSLRHTRKESPAHRSDSRPVSSS